MKVHKLV